MNQANFELSSLNLVRQWTNNETTKCRKTDISEFRNFEY